MTAARVLALALALAACGKGGGVATTGPGARDALLDAWKKGGLSPSAFTASQSPIGKDCAAGTVNNVDVIVCQFATPDDAKKAEDAGLQWVGDTTGAAHALGSLVIGVADRRKADPSGRTINQLFKLASG